MRALAGWAFAFLVLVSLAGCESGPTASVELRWRAADAWTWTKAVPGSQHGCDRIAFTVNGSPAGHALTPRSGTFTANVPMRAGRNVVVAECRTGDASVESKPLVVTERLEARPTARIHVAVDGGTVLFDSESTPSRGASLTTFDWSARAGNPAPLEIHSTGEHATAVAPQADGEYYVTLEVRDSQDRSDRSTTYFVVSGGKARLVDMDHEHPAWVDRAVVYGTVPKLFGRHPFRAVTAKLDYLKRLGVNTLWLSPINSTPEGDFGYAVTDYFNLNSRYGTKEEFRKLVDAAHARGIRVLMDFVPNHTSDEHPYFKDTVAHKRASPYWTYYDRDSYGDYNYYFDWSNLPNLNYDNPEVRAMITEAFSYWVREFDVDGFRVDAAWGIKMRRPSFWLPWRRELKRIKPDLLLLAEASATDGYYFRRGFDAAYDWTPKLGDWAWDGVFDDSDRIVQRLVPALTFFGRGYPKDALVFRFLNNNDTGPRFIVKHEKRLTLAATALLMTLPGIPELYTGDEIGASYLPYDQEFPLDWKDARGMRAAYSKLIDLRLGLPSLTTRKWKIVAADRRRQIFAFVRWGAGDPVLAVFNFGLAPTEASIALPSRFVRSLGGDLEDRLNGGVFRADTMPMPPESARILMPR